LLCCAQPPRAQPSGGEYPIHGWGEGSFFQLAQVSKEVAMEARADETTTAAPRPLNNAEIADRLASLAQLLSTQKEKSYKIKAYQRAASKIRTLSESLDERVREEADLTRYAGIGEAIASAIREIVRTGTLGKLETLRSQVSPALASITQHPRLDPNRVMRVYKKLGISSVEELRERL
jgi:DNA polymerase (family 10)